MTKPYHPILQPNNDLATGLALCLPLHEGAGTLAHDLSGYGNDGTFNGGVTWADGPAGKCLSFTDTLQQYVECAGLNDGPITIACWVLVRSGAINWPGILSQQEAGNPATNDRNLFVKLVLGLPKFNWYLFDGAGKTCTGATTVTADTWYHVVATADGATMKLYVNGALDGSLSAGLPYAAYSSPRFRVGHAPQNPLDAWMNGSVDAVSRWSRALSPAEVAALYADSWQMVRPPNQLGSAGVGTT